MKWSCNLAYAVGLIASDGNLSPDGRHLSFVSMDRQLVSVFKKSLEINTKISRVNSSFSPTKGACYFRTQFGNISLYRDLVKIGLTPKKSKIIGKLLVPDRYFFDFLRGSFDGDGYVYHYKDLRWKNSHMFYINFTSASLKHLKWIRKTVQRLLGPHGAMHLTSGNTWALRFAKRESISLIRAMYPSKKIPCLLRKRNKIQSILKLAQVAELVDAHV